MKTIPSCRLPSLCSVLAASLFLFTGLVHANGNEVLNPPPITVQAGTGVISGGTGLDIGSGTIPLNVPQNATIKQVLMYWSAKGPTLRNTLVVGGKSVTGSVIGLAGPSNATLQSRGYRADITFKGIVKPGANSINVAGIAVPKGALDGASIVVILKASDEAQYSGRSVALSATIGGLATRIGDTGELPATGGFLTPKPVLGAEVPDLLFSNTVTSSTIGAGGVTVSKTSVEGLGLDLLSLLLGAEVLESSAVAQCTATGAQLTGGSKLLGLFLNADETKVALDPNTVLLDLGIIKITGNEQIKTGGGNSGSITVNALHISAPVLGILGLATDVVVSSATAGVNCLPQIPSQIKIVDGADFAFTPTSGTKWFTVKKTFSFTPTTFDRVAQLHVVLGDAEPAKPDAIQIYRNNVLYKTINNSLNSSEGFEWDNEVLTIPVPAGTSSLSVQPLSKSASGLTDSLIWVAAILDLPSQAPSNVYSGRATVVRADVAGILSVAVADTGALPGTGGSLKAETLNALVPLLPLSSTTASATTVGAGEKSESSAIVEGLGLGLLALASVEADVLKSTAVATCGNDNKASVSGNSTLVKLVINGDPIDLSTTTKIDLGLAQVYLNEQIKAVSGNYGSITVNALRITAPDLTGLLGSDLANVVVGQSHADILCR